MPVRDHFQLEPVGPSGPQVAGSSSTVDAPLGSGWLESVL